MRGPSEAERRFWESYYRTQQLQQQREAELRAIREQAAQWQKQYEAHRAAQERAWAEYQRVLAQTGSPQAAAAAYKSIIASAPPPPPPSPQPISFIAGRAGVSPQPQQQPQPSQPQVPTWAAIGAGAAGLAAAAALARRPAGLLKIASKPVTETVAKKSTITPFFTLLRTEAKPQTFVAGRIGVSPQPMLRLPEFFGAARAQRAAMQASSRAARQVQAAAAARNIVQASTRSASLAKFAKVAKYGAGIGALGLIGYGLFTMAMTPETETQGAAVGGAGAGAPAPRGAGAGAPGVGVGGAGGVGGAPVEAGVGIEAPQGPVCDALGRPIKTTAMAMAPEVGDSVGVLGGAGAEAGLGFGGFGGVEEAGLGGGAGGFGFMPLLILGGAALIIILALALSKKK
jgi:hypothetical protein